MRPENTASNVTLTGEVDEFGIPRAFVSINPSRRRNTVDAMDTAADDVALVFANGQPYKYSLPAHSSLFPPIRRPRRYCRFQAVGTALALPTMRLARWP